MQELLQLHNSKNVQRAFLAQTWIQVHGLQKIASAHSERQIQSALALYVVDISAGFHMMLLWGTYDWRKNDMKRSHRSCCIRRRTWLKMGKISCLLGNCEDAFDSLIFFLELYETNLVLWGDLIGWEICSGFNKIQYLNFTTFDFNKAYLRKRV